MHLLHNVAPTNELTLDIDLWNGWPVRVLFDRGSECLIGEYVDFLVLLDAIGVHKDNHVPAESALGHLSRALHENANVILADPLRDVLSDLVGGLRLGLRLEVVVAIFISATSAVVRVEPSACIHGLLPKGKGWGCCDSLSET